MCNDPNYISVVPDSRARRRHSRVRRVDEEVNMDDDEKHNYFRDWIADGLYRRR